MKEQNQNTTCGLEIFQQIADLAGKCGELSRDGVSCLDLDRSQRCGFPEFVFGSGKSLPELLEISRKILSSGENLLVTRLTEESGGELAKAFPDGTFDLRAKTFRKLAKAPEGDPQEILILTAGTSDLGVALECRHTLEACGFNCELIPDVGVAALHRILSCSAKLQSASICIAVAGLEGALPSVIAGLVKCPVIAVPTSVGYGCSFNGTAALLGMLNSCSSGLTVVNIDNGFGAACAAVRILNNRKSGR
jgi:NCAIR mutase (PurE)-related protein